MQPPPTHVELGQPVLMGQSLPQLPQLWRSLSGLTQPEGAPGAGLGDAPGQHSGIMLGAGLGQVFPQAPQLSILLLTKSFSPLVRSAHPPPQHAGVVKPWNVQSLQLPSPQW